MFAWISNFTVHVFSTRNFIPTPYFLNFNALKMVLINLFCSLYTHAHADTGGLSTNAMVALGVGIVTLAVIILVSCCTKKHCNSQLQGEEIMYSSGIVAIYQYVEFTSHDNTNYTIQTNGQNSANKYGKHASMLH